MSDTNIVYSRRVVNADSFLDNDELMFGTDDDIVIDYNGSDFIIDTRGVTATADVVIGTGEGASVDAVGPVLRAPDLAAGTDKAGGDFDIKAGAGTGAGDVGQVRIFTPRVNGTGVVVQTVTQIASFDEDLLTLSGNLFVDNGFGVLIGDGTQLDVGGTPELQVLGLTESDSAVLIGRFSNDASSGSLQFIKGQGAALGDLDIVTNNDVLGIISFYGADVVDLATESAQFSAEVDDASPAAGDIGTAFVWKQMAGGGTALLETMRLAAGGVLILGVGEEGTTLATGNTLRSPDITTGGAGNVAGSDLTVAAGLGTGTGDVGQIIFQTPKAASAGDNAQALSTLMTLDGHSVSISSAAATTGTTLNVANTSNNGAAQEDSILAVSVGGTTTIGDPMIRLTVTGSSDIADGTYQLGINNNTDDILVFGVGTSAFTTTNSIAWIDGRASAATIKRVQLRNNVASTLDDGAGALFTALDILGQTVTLAGTTQVTSLAGTGLTVNASIIAQSGGAVVVNTSTGILVSAPVPNTSVTLTDSSAVWVKDTGTVNGTLTRYHGIFVETLTKGTANYSITLGDSDADQNLIHVGVTGDPILGWDESVDVFTITHGLNMQAGIMILGSGEAGVVAGTGLMLRSSDAAAGGAGDVVGTDLTIAAGLGTGVGDAGTIIFQTPRVAGAGDNIQALTTLLLLDEGVATVSGDLVVADGNGVIIGSATQLVVGGTPEVQVLGITQSDSSILIGQFEADAVPPSLQFVKGRGAVGAGDAVIDNDLVGSIDWYPADSDDLTTLAARFYAEVDDATPADGFVGMAYVWEQMAGGAAALLETMRLGADGVLVLGVGEEGATAAAASGNIFRAPDLVTGGGQTNQAGADMTIAAGLGTGTGTRGTIIFQTPKVATAGDNIQALSTLMTLSDHGVTVSSAAGATNATFTVANSSNTGATQEDSIVNISVGGTTTIGDPMVRWTVTGSTDIANGTYQMGINNNTDDIFVFGVGTSAFSTTNSLLWVDGRSAADSITRFQYRANVDATLADGASAAFTSIGIFGQAITLAGTTTVTALKATGVDIGLSTISQSGGAVIVNDIAGIKVSAPIPDTSVTLTDSAALWVQDGGTVNGTLTNYHGLMIGTLTKGSSNYAITIGDTDADQNLIHVGVGGDPVFGWLETTDTFTINKGLTVTAGTLVVGTAPTYAVTNGGTDRTYDADATSDAEVADVLATVIADLVAIGLFQA